MISLVYNLLSNIYKLRYILHNICLERIVLISKVKERDKKPLLILKDNILNKSNNQVDLLEDDY